MHYVPGVIFGDGTKAPYSCFFDSSQEDAANRARGARAPTFDDRQRLVYPGSSQAGPGNDIHAGSPGLLNAPTRGPASLARIFSRRAGCSGRLRHSRATAWYRVLTKLTAAGTESSNPPRSSGESANHHYGRLMAAVAARISDRRILRLFRNLCK